MNIARAGRQVDKEEIQLLPQGLVYHLAQCAGSHRATPYQSAISIHKEANRHNLYAILLGREDKFLFATDKSLRLVTLNTKHLRL